MSSLKPSSLFRYIEQLQDGSPWGAMLDAGTGVKSIHWVAGLATSRWTAVTGAPGDAARVREAIGAQQRPQDQIVQGNWADGTLLQNDMYDTVLADYLLGAVEGFAPYFQPYLFARLRPLTRQVLYVTGVEPYVPSDRPEAEADRLVWDIGRFRDSCLLLSGDMPYREYPSGRVVDQIRRAGFTIRDMKRFPNHYDSRFVHAQIDLSVARLETMQDQALAEALRRNGEDLRNKALDVISKEGALKSGFDYVIAANPA